MSLHLNMLQNAGSSSMFWITLAAVLIVAIVGYILSRRFSIGHTGSPETGRIVQDWIPTGRIDFAGPSMDESASDVPAAFYLQAEDIRLLISLSGIERKEIRWREATLNEAKRVVNVFHRQFEKKSEPITGTAVPNGQLSGEAHTENISEETH